MTTTALQALVRHCNKTNELFFTFLIVRKNLQNILPADAENVHRPVEDKHKPTFC
jgi:hypothetical protein